MKDGNIQNASLRRFFLLQALLAAFNPHKSEAFRRLGHDAGNDENSRVLKVRVSPGEKEMLDLAAKGEPMVLILGTARWFACELWQFIQEWEFPRDEQGKILYTLNPEPGRWQDAEFYYPNEGPKLRRRLFEKIVPLAEADFHEKRLAELRRPAPNQSEETWFARRRTTLSICHIGVAEEDPTAVFRLFSEKLPPREPIDGNKRDSD